MELLGIAYISSRRRYRVLERRRSKEIETTLFLDIDNKKKGTGNILCATSA